MKKLENTKENDMPESSVASSVSLPQINPALRDRMMGEVQSLLGFKCMNFEIIAEPTTVVVCATVGSAYDRARLMAALNPVVGSFACVYQIQIDPLLSSPFAPTLPVSLQPELEKGDAAWSQVFFLSGLNLAESQYEH